MTGGLAGRGPALAEAIGRPLPRQERRAAAGAAAPIRRGRCPRAPERPRSPTHQGPSRVYGRPRAGRRARYGRCAGPGRGDGRPGGRRTSPPWGRGGSRPAGKVDRHHPEDRRGARACCWCRGGRLFFWIDSRLDHDRRRARRLPGPSRRHPGHQLAAGRLRQPRGPDRGPAQEARHRQAAGQRTDTMMLLHIPDGDGRPTLVSLPRDS